MAAKGGLVAWVCLLLLARINAQPGLPRLGQEFLEGLSQSSQAWLRRSLQEMDAAISAQPLVTTALAAHMASKPAQAPVATGTTQLPAVKLGDVGVSPYALNAEALATLVESLKSQVCTEAVLVPGEKVPAMIVGPQLNLTISLGSCNITEGWHNKTLNCVHPSVSYVKTPITYVSKHHSPEVFISGSCSIAREHGHKSETVLYSGGEDVVYDSVEAFLSDITLGAFDVNQEMLNAALQKLAAAANASAATMAAATAASTTAAQQPAQQEEDVAPAKMTIAERTAWLQAKHQGKAVTSAEAGAGPVQGTAAATGAAGVQASSQGMFGTLSSWLPGGWSLVMRTAADLEESGELSRK